MSKRLILVTNDDGVHAPGILELAKHMQPLGDVWVVAPVVEKSGCGQALTLTDPLRLTQIETQRFALDGTPTDCVLFSICHLLPRKPDWVVSGINRGLNAGQDTCYSGTVAAAMEGSLNGIQSLAVSLNGNSHKDQKEYEHAAKIASYVIEHEEEFASVRGKVINLNVPHKPLSEIKGIRVAPLGFRRYASNFERREDPRGKNYFWLSGHSDGYEDIPGSDCNLLGEDYATLTILTPDRSHYESHAKLEEGTIHKLNDYLQDRKI